MGFKAPTPRVPDGYRDRLLSLADDLDQGAAEQREARYDRLCPQVAMRNASIDAERIMARVADQLRRLRR